MVDEILFCMVQFIFYKTYRAMNLDGFEKLLASVCLSLFRISHLARASAQHLCFLPWCLFLSSILKIHLFHRSSAAWQGQRYGFCICHSCSFEYRSIPQNDFGFNVICKETPLLLSIAQKSFSFRLCQIRCVEHILLFLAS